MMNKNQGYPPAGNGVPTGINGDLKQPSESAPSLVEKTRRTRMGVSSLHPVTFACLVFALSAMVFQTWQTWVHFMYCPPDPVTRLAMRSAWEGENAQHVNLSRQWAREREEHERERVRWRREVKGRKLREEKERQKRHLYWGHVKPYTCTTYATREYTPRLMNLPRDRKHRLDACKATPLKIHGISYLPNTCEDWGPDHVTGRWQINEREPDCTTFWSSYDDKGCSSPGSGKKYITHKLMNLPEKADWKEFCATTPAYFNDMHFPGAQVCFTAVWDVYGQWEIEDSNC